MSQTIWKFPINPHEIIELEMPYGAKILTVQTQRNEPQLWALVDPHKPPMKRWFRLYGTGHVVEDLVIDKSEFIGSFQLDNGALVFHLFEVLL